MCQTLFGLRNCSTGNALIERASISRIFHFGAVFITHISYELLYFCGLGENTDLYITLSLFMYLLQAAFSVDSPEQLMMSFHMY